MKGIAVFPGKTGLRCGVDGTDKEINAGEYGAAPPGHELAES